MKKRKDWIRKASKRLKKKKDHGIVDFMMIIHHFFKDMNNWIGEFTDPRNVSYITYSQQVLINMGILKNVCSMESMRQMEEAFNEETCIHTLGLLSSDFTLEEMPHYDTFNNYLERLSPKNLSALRKKMVKSLIRGKQFNRGRWKIENEGFNNQKNGLYRIEHLNSRNSNALKNHYLLTQIADILMQLYLGWCPLTKQIGQSIKNTSSRLLESFRQQTVTDEDVLYIQRYTTVHLE